MSSALPEGTSARSLACPVEGSPRGFWSAYWASLKPLDVEEPVDVWIHRPIAYVLARGFVPTGVSPNAITFVSILFGIAAGIALFGSFDFHLQVGGLCIFLSAVFDCADGQLARMRGTSSPLGRMLDGAADLVVASAVVGGCGSVILTKYSEPASVQLVVLALAVATAVTGSFHTSLYDHYKNVYLCLTSEKYSEGEDPGTARERFESRKRGETGFWARLAWPIYLFYVDSQEKAALRFDPHTSARFSKFPPHDVRRAAIYRRHCRSLMRIWRSWFGFGALVFGLAVSAAFDVIEWYMLFRLVGMNALFYGYLRPAQRRASKRAFEEMGMAQLTAARAI